MKVLIVAMLMLVAAFASDASATQCNVTGTVNSTVPSRQNIAVRVTGTSACVCQSSGSGTWMWIDTGEASANSLYSAALAAQLAGTAVTVTVDDQFAGDVTSKFLDLPCRVQNFEVQ
jgi:hypothetical protein